jgi:hypothetical protein
MNHAPTSMFFSVRGLMVIGLLIMGGGFGFLGFVLGAYPEEAPSE